MMQLHRYFSPLRFWQLMKLEVIGSLRGILIIMDITFGMLFFMGMLLSLAIEQHVVVFNHEESYAFTLLVGGYVVSSLAFSGASSTRKAQSFLMLPVSAFERFLVMWLLTTVGWVLLYTAVFTAYSLLVNPIGHMIYRNVEFVPFNPIGGFALKVVMYYVLTQGIFLVGAVCFRGYVLPKTLGVLIIFLTVCGVIIYFGLKEVFLAPHECDAVTGECELVDVAQFSGVWAVLKFLFMWVMAPLTWLLTYLGLKEMEV